MTVRIGICSTAHPHAHFYRNALESIDDATVVGVADADDERGEAFADEYGDRYLPTDELLASVDGAIVCSTNTRHGDWVAACADAGVDVLCEKPLATTVDEAVRLRDRCAEAGVHLGVAMPMRFSDPVLHARDAVLAGEIGDVRCIVGTNLLRLPRADWFFDPEAAGGGAVMDHTVHVVDLVRWFTGEEVAEVYAEIGTRIHDIPVEDLDVLSMSLTDGTPVSHDGSWRQPDAWDFWGDVTLRLIGTEGILEVDCFDQTFTLTRDAGVGGDGDTGGDGGAGDNAGDAGEEAGETADGGIESVYWGSDVNEGLIRDFCHAVRDGREPEITATDGVREVAVVEAAYESAERNESVQVSYPDSS